ncbi:unnamed protein product [Lepeophtheirus salmonis]|uniref:(salmon louse) hypothetical protein n=1 Tax=Lepeophtheirus salmonis TaxID=72036 RepID=A0A7R8D1E6_LEPSM|nr:unnamed protein product [Lepeophtheirus salmonis]CAF2994846.1 unnamed protein product [Lepeophtheirus salmonis]
MQAELAVYEHGLSETDSKLNKCKDLIEDCAKWEDMSIEDLLESQNYKKVQDLIEFNNWMKDFCRFYSSNLMSKFLLDEQQGYLDNCLCLSCRGNLEQCLDMGDIQSIDPCLDTLNRYYQEKILRPELESCLQYMYPVEGGKFGFIF